MREVETLVKSLKPHVDATFFPPEAIDPLAAKLAEIAERTPGLVDFSVQQPAASTITPPAPTRGANAAPPNRIKLRTTRKGNLTYLKGNYLKAFEGAARDLGITVKSFANRFQITEDRLYFILVGSDPVPPILFTALREIMETPVARVPGRG
jgi:hypothetical protein